MKDLASKTFRIALVQAAPVVFDKEQTTAIRMEFDGAGHYSRPDVLELIVHEN